MRLRLSAIVLVLASAAGGATLEDRETGFRFSVSLADTDVCQLKADVARQDPACDRVLGAGISRKVQAQPEMALKNTLALSRRNRSSVGATVRLSVETLPGLFRTPLHAANPARELMEGLVRASLRPPQSAGRPEGAAGGPEQAPYEMRSLRGRPYGRAVISTAHGATRLLMFPLGDRVVVLDLRGDPRDPDPKLLDSLEAELLAGAVLPEDLPASADAGRP